MPKPPVKQFVPQSNTNILNAIRKVASIDYQRRIPEATKANIQETLHELLTHPGHRNEFVHALINRIGAEIIRGASFSNPLSKFKRDVMVYGDSIEEIQIGLAKSYVYDPDREALERAIFGQHRPDVQASLHKINRQEYYVISVNEDVLRRAFTAEYGLSNMVAELMAVPTNSDQWDEYLTMTSLFKEYEDANGFFKVNVPDITTTPTEANSKQVLRELRAWSTKLQFLSRYYNASGMPVSAKPEDLELFITPEADASLDVDALAAAFNIDRADYPMRRTLVRQEDFNVEGVQAILTTKDFFVVADTLLETRQQVNPAGLFDNYFFHHHQIISASRFVPAIMFTTEAGTVITANNTPVTSVEPIVIQDTGGSTVAGDLTRGTTYQVLGSAITTPSGGDNDSVRIELEGATSALTYVTQTGVLHIGADETAESITINIVAVDDNSETATTTRDLVGEVMRLWPDPEVYTPPLD